MHFQQSLLFTTTLSLLRRQRPTASFQTMAHFVDGAAPRTAPPFDWRWLEEVESTQETAREVAQARESPHFFAVGAARQTRGRGTHNRTWVGHDGNVFLTVGVPTALISLSPITLVPLRIGTLLASVVSTALPPADRARLSLKVR